MPKISVIIPAYNAMTFLPETICSVLSQTYENFEVVIVNDGSTDDIEQWIAKIRDSRIRLISQENQGLAGARNTGIYYAKGEYLAFLDADDLWKPTKLEKQVTVLENDSEIGLVYTWVAYIDENSKLTGRVFRNQAEGNVWEKLIKHNIVECGSVALVRRCCFETCGVFDKNLGSFVEDWDMWLRISRHYQFKVVKQTLVYYRQLSTSISKNWESMERSFQIVIEKAFASNPEGSQDLKKQSYGCANLCLAWKPLQSKNKDYKQAQKYRQKAILSYPFSFLSKEFVRLSLAIIIIQLLGPKFYEQFLGEIYTFRRRLLETILSNSIYSNPN